MTSLISRRIFFAKLPRKYNNFCIRHLCNTQTQNDSRPKMAWLDLRGAGLSAIERLSIEELLLRHDPLERCWGIIGIHEPTHNRLLKTLLPPYNDNADKDRELLKEEDRLVDIYGHVNDHIPNRSCAIIMGIGGKPKKLIDIQSAKNDNVLVIKRFSGGGTVVVDHSSLWTTFIGRNKILKDRVKPYPREIMIWSADTIFGPAFDSLNREMMNATSDNKSRKRGRQTLVFQGKSSGCSDVSGEALILPPSIEEDDEIQQQTSTLPSFQLRENDYVLGERKIGGNAQTITGDSFLHHTSFLWDWDNTNMDYLALPDKRPDYRGDRSHEDFLVRLKDHYGNTQHSSINKNSLFQHVKTAANASFELEEIKLNDVLDIANDKFGGLQQWFDTKCRTKIVKL